MTKKLLAMLLSVLLIVSVFAGCGKTGGTGTDGQDNQQNTAEPDNSENKGENGKVIFTDSCGREVELDSDITRIVPTGPVAQIALLAIAPEMYVGISSEWDDINREYIGDELLDLPLIGQLYGGKGEVNLEAVSYTHLNILRHHCSCSYYSIISDCNPWHYAHSRPYPYVTAYFYRPCILKTFKALPGVKGVPRRVKPAVWTDQYVVSKNNLITVQYYAVVICIEIFTYLNVISVIAPKRRLDQKRPPCSAKKPPYNLPLLLKL